MTQMTQTALALQGPWRRAFAHLVVAVAAIGQEMTFIGHLEELRKRLLWAVVCVAATFAVCWMFSRELYDIASAPIRSNPAVTLSVSRPQDIFDLYMKVTLVASIFFSSPLILTQVHVVHVQRDRFLARLAEATGGRTGSAASDRQLEALFQRVLDEMRARGDVTAERGYVVP